MATLVLTVAGGAVGGPIGAAIGAALGRSIDREVLFEPGRREGPRLTELAVQTSSYGTPIPRLFGTMRVAGTVIWSTDLIETRSTEGGGKGQPETTRYSYSASFAVLLSARAIRSVKRIWADGKLLRGSAGDFKSKVAALRIHSGGEDQDADPLIASREGNSATPGHRGAAYAVFEDLQLADFGNRIPSLTFEVEADAGDVDIGAIAEGVTEGLVRGSGGLSLGGFSAYGSDDRAVVEMLADAGGCWFAPDEDGLVLTSGSGDSVTVVDAGVHASDKDASTGTRTIAAADTAPEIVSVRHYDRARDYQAGIQRAGRGRGTGRTAKRVELPAVLSAVKAKALAEAVLARADIARERRRVTLGWDALALAPGARVTIAGEAGQWRIAGWSLEAMVVALDLVRIGYPAAVADASSGRVLPAPDLVAGHTVLAPFELPPLDETLRNTPLLGVAAAGDRSGWRSAALLLSEDDGASWRPIGGTALPTVIGTIVEPAGAAPAPREDRANFVEIELAHAAMVLGQADRALLDGGANLAMLGDELIQFGSAEQVDERRWRLRMLWRGRRGTEAAIGTQQPGDRFALIVSDALATVDLSAAAVGGSALIEASGVGDVPDPAHASAAVSGCSIVPPSPVHLRAEREADGALLLRWTRRSRLGWRWVDGVDAPLGEDDERYAVTLERGDGTSVRFETSDPALHVAEDELGAGAATISVRQIGTNGMSLPATITVS